MDRRGGFDIKEQMGTNFLNQPGLINAAKALLEEHWNGRYTFAAKDRVWGQCSWDSCWVALAYAHYDQHRAEQEIRSIFEGQWSNGMIPHIRFEDNEAGTEAAALWQSQLSEDAPKIGLTSGICALPILGMIILKLHEMATDKVKSLQFLAEVYPKVVKYHEFLYNHRDPKEEGLISIIHPWESGMDNTPIWDEILEEIPVLDLREGSEDYLNKDNALAGACIKLIEEFKLRSYDPTALIQHSPFLVQDPFFNAVLCWSNESLLKVGHLLGQNVSDILHWHELTIYSMNEKLWDELSGLFQAYDLRSDFRLSYAAVNGLMPMAGEVPTQDQAEVMLMALESAWFTQEEAICFLCPSYNMDSPDFESDNRWRGAIWILTNWMLYQGLNRYDFEELSTKVLNDSLKLVSEYGFYEYFDPRLKPIEHLGYGASRFSVTAALCLDFLFNRFK